MADMANNNYIITRETADVTGDGVLDTITLTGFKEKPDDIFIRNITLVVVNGATKKEITVTFANNAGYNPRIFLGDFTGDNIPEVMLSIDSGGSGGFGFYYIYSFKNGIPQKLFDNDEFNNKYKYDVTFREGCKIAVYSHYFARTYFIDVSDRKDFYIAEGVYNRSCQLLKPTEGFVPGLNNLYPLRDSDDNKYRLLAIQRIIGLYGADTVGYIEMTLEWQVSSFVPISERVTSSPRADG